MNLTQSIEIVQSFRNWTNDATLPMTHTKGEVIEALDKILSDVIELTKYHNPIGTDVHVEQMGM